MGTVYLSLFCSVEFKNFFFFYYLLPIFNIWDPTPLLFACGVSFACLVLQLLYYMTPGRLLHFSESPHLNSGDNNNNYTLQGCHEGPARFTCFLHAGWHIILGDLEAPGIHSAWNWDRHTINSLGQVPFIKYQRSTWWRAAIQPGDRSSKYIN